MKTQSEIAKVVKFHRELCDLGGASSDDARQALSEIKKYLMENDLEFNTLNLARLGDKRAIGYIKRGYIDGYTVRDGKIVNVEYHAPEFAENIGGILVSKTHNVAFGFLITFLLEKGSYDDMDGNTYLVSCEQAEKIKRQRLGTGVSIEGPCVMIDEKIINVTCEEFDKLGLPECPAKWYQPPKR